MLHLYFQGTNVYILSQWTTATGYDSLPICKLLVILIDILDFHCKGLQRKIWQILLIGPTKIVLKSWPILANTDVVNLQTSTIKYKVILGMKMLVLPISTMNTEYQPTNNTKWQVNTLKTDICNITDHLQVPILRYHINIGPARVQKNMLRAHNYHYVRISLNCRCCLHKTEW